MSGGGIKRAQELHGEQFVRKKIDEELIVVVNKTRREVILEDLTDRQSKILRRKLIPIVDVIEECRGNIHNGSFDVNKEMSSVLNEDRRRLLKSIDYYLAGDYGAESVRDAVSNI